MSRPCLLIPKWTNGAFAAELALKYLLARAKRSYGDIHDLYRLFHRLPEDHRAELITRIKNEAHQTDEMIEEQLLVFSNAFVKSRYFYEHDSFGLTGLFEPFVKIVCEYALALGEQEDCCESSGEDKSREAKIPSHDSDQKSANN